MEPSYRRFALACVLGLACPPAAFAQADYSLQNREWETSVSVGASVVRDFSFPTRVSGNGAETSRTVGVHYANGYQVSWWITQNLSDYWTAELGYIFANQPLRFSNLSPDVESLSLSQYVHNMPYSVSFNPVPLYKRFRPYGTAGVGLSLFHIPEASKNDALDQGIPLRDSWHFGLHWGGGFKYLVRDQFVVRMDVLDYMTPVPSYGLPSSAKVVNGQYQPGIGRNGWLNQWQFSWGLAFQWDEP